MKHQTLQLTSRIRIKIFNSKLLLSVFSLLLLIAQPSIAAPLKILPLGDSITDGFGYLNSPDDHAYRDELNTLLVQNGYDFDYVGTRGTYPLEHEGVTGLRADEILNGNGGSVPDLATKLVNYDADIVLLHAGTNDILQHHDGSAPTTDAATLADIQGIITLLHCRLNTLMSLFTLHR